MALPAAVWTDSPTVLPKSSRKPANSIHQENRQRLAGYVALSYSGRWPERVVHLAGDIYEYRLSPARFPLPGAVVTPGTPRTLDYARQKLPGEPAGEFWIAPRAGESWAQGSTGAARQPSVRP